MRLARVDTPDGIVAGEYEDGVVRTGDTSYAVGGDVELLPPCDPSVLYCAGRTYRDYIELTGADPPETLHFFLKPPASVFPPDREIPHPPFSDEIGYAGELAAVIDRECSGIAPAEVPDYVRGYTIMNDLDALDQDDAAKKVFDNAAPIGPWIETDVTPQGLDMRTTVGGEVRQEATTDELLQDPAEIIAYLAERVTLRPGDVVAFGSPANPGVVEPDEAVECWYEGIGTLRNTLGPRA